MLRAATIVKATEVVGRTAMEASRIVMSPAWELTPLLLVVSVTELPSFKAFSIRIVPMMASSPVV
jgi:hypothetical protein